MRLTRENYHSREANEKYFSSSQLKDFRKCENLALYNIRHSDDDEKKECFKQGHFGHAWNEGPEQFLQFKQDHPEIYTKTGSLKAEYKKIESSLFWLEKDPFVMDILRGLKEQIATAEIFGHKAKIMMDTHNRFRMRIADLKLMKSLSDKYWCPAERRYVSWIDFYNYPMSMAFYAEVERLFSGEKDYCFPFLVAVSKEDTPNKDVIKFADTQKEMSEFVAFQLEDIAENIDRWAAVKLGEVEPNKCGVCIACLKEKMITAATHYSNYL